ncbi:hypothetical protein [Modestobacter altitudinis]|nr:hypothetical protein [Modestobacter altitudinis]
MSTTCSRRPAAALGSWPTSAGSSQNTELPVSAISSPVTSAM